MFEKNKNLHGVVCVGALRSTCYHEAYLEQLVSLYKLDHSLLSSFREYKTYYTSVLIDRYGIDKDKLTNLCDSWRNLGVHKYKTLGQENINNTKMTELINTATSYEVDVIRQLQTAIPEPLTGHFFGDKEDSVGVKIEHYMDGSEEIFINGKVATKEELEDILKHPDVTNVKERKYESLPNGDFKLVKQSSNKVKNSAIKFKKMSEQELEELLTNGSKPNFNSPWNSNNA